jgi:hypothetical protein
MRHMKAGKGTQFCSECGTENPASAASCESCGRVLDPLAEVTRATGPARKLNGAAVATVTGICVIAVVLAWLTESSMELTVRQIYRFEGERPVSERVLASDAGLAQVFGLTLAFGLAGLVAALVFAGRYLREVVLGAAAGAVTQMLLWLYMAHAAGGTLRGDLWVVGEGFVMRGPAPMLLTQLLIMMVFATMTLAFAGWVGREQITGKATCVYCHTSHSLRPKPPLRCPKCDAEQERDGVQWPHVMLVALVSMIVFMLIVAFLREPLGFALECSDPLSKECIAARRDDAYQIFVTALDRNEFVYWAIAQWRYIGFTAVLMFAAPLVLSFLVKRGSRASAGALVPINWLLATFVIMVVLSDLGGSDAGFIFLMRMQVLALFCWGVAGVIGVLLGDRLRYRSGSAYLDEIQS